MMHCRSVCLLLAALCLTGCHHASSETFLPGTAHPAYTITDLGEGMPTAINNHAQVAGIYAAGVFPGPDKFPYLHGCLWQNGTRTEMPTLGGWYSNAGTIDDAGRIWGSATVAGRERPGFPVTHGCVWDRHTLTDLDAAPRFRGTQAMHQTPSGAIYAVSPVQPADKARHLWLFPNGLRPGPHKDLGKIGGPLVNANAINDRGTVIGALGTKKNPKAGFDSRAFIWHVGDKHWMDLGTFGGKRTHAAALNNKDQVVGDASLPEDDPSIGPRTHAFLWDHGQMHDLGTLPGGSNSVAHALNDSGQVVGFSDTAHYHLDTVGVLWEGGQIKKLPTLIPSGTHWISLGGGAGINNQGQIVGDGAFAGDKDRYVHGYLLTPIPAVR